MTKMLDEGEAYDWRVGRWSGMVGEAFVAWLGRPAGLRWLELGCGAGALSRAALEVGGAASLVGVDPSAGAIARAGAIVDDARADFRQGAAEALAFPDDGFDVVVSGLALNFMADSSAAMLEMSRVVVPGGTIAGYVWDFAGEMQVFRRFWDRYRGRSEGRRFGPGAALSPLPPGTAAPSLHRCRSRRRRGPRTRRRGRVFRPRDLLAGDDHGRGLDGRLRRHVVGGRSRGDPSASAAKLGDPGRRQLSPDRAGLGGARHRLRG